MNDINNKFSLTVLLIFITAVGIVGLSAGVAADAPASENFTDNTSDDVIVQNETTVIATGSFSDSKNVSNVTVNLTTDQSVSVDDNDIASIGVNVTNSTGSSFTKVNSSVVAGETLINLNGGDNITNVSSITINATANDTANISVEGAELDSSFTLYENASGTFKAGNNTTIATTGVQTIDAGGVFASTNDAVESGDQTPTVNVSFKSVSGVNSNSLDVSVRNLNTSTETTLVSGGSVQGDASFTSATNFSSSSNITTFANISAPTLQEGNYTINASVNTSNANSFQNNSLNNSNSEFQFSRQGVGLKTIADSSNPLAGNQANISVVAIDADGNELIFNETDVGTKTSNIGLAFSDAANVTNNNKISGSDTRPIFNTSANVYNSTIAVNYSEIGSLGITARDLGGNLTPSPQVSQTYTAQISGVEVTSDDGQLIADGSDTENVTLQLVDQNGDAIPRAGESVSFGIISGNAGPSDANVTEINANATTDSTGAATVTYNATNAGFTIKVSAQENNRFDGTATFDTVSGDISAAQSTFKVNSSTDPTATVGEQLSVNVTLKDTEGNPVSGFEPTLTANKTGASFADSTPKTNSTGTATTTVTLPETAGVVKLNVSAGAFNASASPRAQNNVTANADTPVSLQFPSDQSTTLAAGTTGNNLTVEAVDQFGNANGSGTVTLTSENAGVFTFPGGSSDDTQDVNLGGNGVGTTSNLDANESAGETTITATIPDSNITNTSATFTVGEPQGVDVTFTSDVSTSSNSNTNSTATLEAQLLGPDGSPIGVENENISFARLSGNAAEFDQSLSSFETQTNANGLATIQVNATSNTGQTEFLAQSVNYSASNSGTVTTTGAANSISITTNTSSVSQNGTVSVTASFVDSEGRTVPRVDSISVSSLNLGGTVNPGSNTTAFDSSGEAVATYTYTADGQTGSETLRAIGGGVTGTDTLTVNEQAGSGTGSPLSGTAGQYDGDGDGKVTASELGNASTAFAQGSLTASELGDVAVAFAQS